MAAAGSVRVVGRSHSFTPVCDTTGLLLSLAKMQVNDLRTPLPPLAAPLPCGILKAHASDATASNSPVSQAVLDFDDTKGTITVEGGATYTAVNAYLKKTRWAAKNLATLPHFTVAGSMSMGTHGSSGVDPDGAAQLGNQASQVVAVEFVTAGGELRAYSREADPLIFPGSLHPCVPRPAAPTAAATVCRPMCRRPHRRVQVSRPQAWWCRSVASGWPARSHCSWFGGTKCTSAFTSTSRSRTCSSPSSRCYMPSCVHRLAFP